jgi:beta-galactosidase GanA
MNFSTSFQKTECVLSCVLHPYNERHVRQYRSPPQLTYKNNYYKGEAALIRNKSGKGSAYYFGGTFNRESAMVFLKKLDIKNPYKNILSVPEGCELAVRKNSEKNTSLFLILQGKKQ